MPTFAQRQQLDASFLEDGDDLFIGVNERLSPPKLNRGYASSAQNKRFVKGVVTDRLGYISLPWSNVLDLQKVQLPPPYTFRIIDPFDSFQGTGRFKDPNGYTWQIVAANGKVYRMRENNFAVEVPLPASLTLSGDIRFSQHFNVMLLWRGEDLEPLVMENLGAGFAPLSGKIVTSVSEMRSPNTQFIPNGSWGEPFQNRLLTWVGDLVYVSDILDYTRYAPATGAFRINQGESDSLVRVIQYSEIAVLCLKENHVYLLGNLIPDYGGNFSQATLDQITDEFGCASAKSAVRVGNDVWWMANKKGVVSLTQTAQGKVQAITVPISDPMQPTIERINWDYADRIVAANWSNKTYFAVPLDSGEIRRPDLVDADTYVGQSLTYTVQPGKSYHWTPGANEAALINGTEVLTEESDFTAQGSTVQAQTGGVLFSEDWEGENGNASEANYEGFSQWDVVSGGIDLCGGALGPFTDAYMFPDDTPSGAGMYIDARGSGWPGDCVLRTKADIDFTAGIEYKITFKLAHHVLIAGTPHFHFTIGALVNEEVTLMTADEMFGEFVYEFTFTPGVNTSAKLTITSDEIFPNFDSGGVVIDEIVIETTAGGGDDVTGSIVPFYRGVNTAVMVYDHLNNAWAGIDRVIDADGNDALLVQDFFKHRFMGEERLFAILADGRVVIVEYGFYDDVIDTAATFQRVEIQPMFKSRGYDFQFASEKQYISCLAAFKTWNPKVTFKSYVDGVRESKILMADMTRDRTKFWRPAWKAPWSEDNSGDDFFDPDREDYSVFLGPLDEIDLGANGIDPDLLQDSQEGFRVNERGRYVQIEIIGSQGRCALEALSVNAAPGEQQLNRQQ